MEVPEELLYTEDHEWVRPEDGRLRVGITDYAQDALGDIVFVELPEPGSSFEAGDQMAEVESTKSVAEVYAPVAGTIAEVNPALAETPEIVNTSPYGEGWFVVIEAEGEDPTAGLLDAAAYRELIG